MSEEIAQGERLVRAFDQTYPVTVAFWMKGEGLVLRYLYIASEGIDTETKGAAYDEIDRIINDQQLTWINEFRVNLLAADSPLAREVVRVAGKTRKRHYSLGGHDLVPGESCEDGLVYPSLQPVAA